MLEIFEDEPGVFTAEQLFARLGYTRSTTYRYLKVLSDSGLLTSWHGSGYSLGPRVVELQAFMMARDPLLLVSKPEMRNVCRSVAGLIALSRRFKDRLLCVHSECSVSGLKSDLQIGRARPMISSGAARVVLSRLGAQQLRKFYDVNAHAINSSGMASSLVELRAKLRHVREQGYEYDRAEGEEGLTSISVALTDLSGAPLGCLTLDVPTRATPTDAVPGLARHVVDAAQNIGRAIISPSGA